MREVADRIGNRKLVWFGTRGEDGSPLLALPQFKESYAVTARMAAASLDVNVALEDEMSRRVDLDCYDIDLDGGDEVREMRRRLLASLASPSVLLSYRPNRFLASAHFPNVLSVQRVGMFHECQYPFEHKPWVETQLREDGVCTIPWEYVADEDHLDVVRRLDREPVVLRASRTSGGQGIVLVESAEDLDLEWPRSRDAIVSVAPYLRNALPVNVAACVFPDGTIVLHPASVQLVGVPELTGRRFGYCGNDFGAIRQLDRNDVEQLEELVYAVGSWLCRRGYVGAFGMDALLHAGTAYFTEVNPRFQGSSWVAADIARQVDLSDLYLDHLAAFLGLDPPSRLGLTDWMAAGASFAQVVCHNTCPTPQRFKPKNGSVSMDSSAYEVDLLPNGDVLVEANATLFRIVASMQVTSDGSDLLPEAQAALRNWSRHFRPAEHDTGALIAQQGES